MHEKAIILLDAGFVKKKLGQFLKRFPKSDDVVDLCSQLMAAEELKEAKLFRSYYYDAPSLDSTINNPIDGSEIRFSESDLYRNNRRLLDELELKPNFAVRTGALAHHGWRLRPSVLEDKKIENGELKITAADIMPDVKQKGVDLKIGLDIAWIALKRIASVLILVTGDSDFVPVMKFARKEGLQVMLAPLRHGVRRELRVTNCSLEAPVKITTIRNCPTMHLRWSQKCN